MQYDPFHAFDTLSVDEKNYGYYKLAALNANISELPFSIRVLLESVLRSCDGEAVFEKDVKNLAQWKPEKTPDIEVPFKPARVILQDFTGVPAFVDLAAMRSAMERFEGDPKKVNPLIPTDLIIDHSVQTDFSGSPDAFGKNIALEFSRNTERYSLLKWAQNSLDNFRVIPPSVGIIHQVNLEYLASVVVQNQKDGDEFPVIYPDSVVGTDSHTVMINGLGVLGWGVGGIEAEAVMLGLPYYMLAPEVIGLELVGKLKPGITATDLVLTITEMLRQEGVVGKFVEYLGTGVETMPVADRAVLANMGPEYGATMGFFPIDEKTIQFLRDTGRDEHHVAVVEKYAKENQLFRDKNSPVPKYTKTLKLDLGTVEPSVAGPKRPQDRIPLAMLKKTEPRKSSGDLPTNDSVVIASITSCTNTSNPRLMITAGLLAKKAVEKGLTVPKFVKTSLAPGSRVVTEYLKRADLLSPLEKLGFQVVGYGCLTCIGNSGPLAEPVAAEITDKNLNVAAVLSGNRNFEGRVHPLVKSNYLASPPLVVAFALAGTTNLDMNVEPIGTDLDEKPVYLKDIWPSESEIDAVESVAADPQMYRNEYDSFATKSEKWNAIQSSESEIFDWDRSSTYIQEPPFFMAIRPEPSPIKPIDDARVLAFFGDSVTTDHISPAGSIKPDSPAGKYLLERGVKPEDFNSYGSRRGNDRVMTRGTFANIRIRNLLVPGTEGGVTKFHPTGEIMPIYDAAMEYQKTRTPLIILAGAEYGTGSSRDWAAKGTALLGVRAVIATSFERIHRSNLIGMGVLPLEFIDATAQSLNLDGTEKFTFEEIDANFKPGDKIKVIANKNVEPHITSGMTFNVRVRIDTPIELSFYFGGGILPYVLRKLH